MLVRTILALIAALIVTSASAAPEIFVQRPCTPAEALRIAPDTAGYCSGGWWVPKLITKASYWQTPPVHTIGRALYYAEGVMEQVAANKSYDISEVEGLVSLLSPSTAGWTFYIKAPTYPDWILVMDVDAAALPHYLPHLYVDSPIELSYALAERLGNIDWTDENGDRYFDVEICLSLQPEVDCAGTPVNYKQWFLSIVRFQ